MNFYACSVKFLEGNIDEHYNWTGDVMSEVWDEKAAMEKLRNNPETLVCDAILNQDIFAGAGNIIKNEVLFRLKLHPENKLKDLPGKDKKKLVTEVRKYCFDFLKWKKMFELKKHYQAHTKKICPRCEIPFMQKKLGRFQRRTFYCENCQVKHS
jgi:endonuclease VIII